MPVRLVLNVDILGSSGYWEIGPVCLVLIVDILSGRGYGEIGPVCLVLILDVVPDPLRTLININ